MPYFAFRCLDGDGHPLSGAVEAATLEAARSELEGKRLRVLVLTAMPSSDGQRSRLPLEVSRPRQDAGAEPADPFRDVPLNATFMRRAPLAPLLLSLRQLSLMLRTGINILRALEVIINGESHAALREAWVCVMARVSSGHPLSDAMASQPLLADPTLISLLLAGELSGNVAETLERYGDYLERSLTLTRRMRGILIYPSILIIGAVLEVVLFFRFAFPPFLELLQSLTSELPIPTRILAACYEAMVNPLVVGGVLTLGAFLAWMLRMFGATPHGREVRDRFMLSLPKVGPTLRRIHMMRAMSALAMMLRSGAALGSSMHVAAVSSGHVVLADEIERAWERIETGLRLPEALHEFAETDLRSMLEVGDDTGQLPHMIELWCRMAQEDVNLRIDQSMTILEPLLIGLLSLAIGGIFIALFVPLYGAIMRLGS
jgi:type IV pilus assembly protein PilC